MLREQLSGVPAAGDGRGEHGACGVDCLEDALEVDASGHLLNQDRCQALGPKLLVHTQKVDLHRAKRLPPRPDSGGDGRDTPYELPALLGTYWFVCPGG